FDSISCEMGVAVDDLGAEGVGAGLVLGFGLDVPLLLPDVIANGLSLRLGARHMRASPHDVHGPEGGISDWSLHAVLTLRTVAGLGIARHEVPRFDPDL